MLRLLFTGGLKGGIPPELNEDNRPLLWTGDLEPEKDGLLMESLFAADRRLKLPSGGICRLS